MTKSNDVSVRDFNEEDSNTSANPSFDSVLAARLSRRNILRGSIGSVATAVLGGASLSACGGGDDPAPAPAPAPGGATRRRACA